MEPIELSDQFEQALVYAFRLHRSQVRKGRSIHYIAHVISVAALVLEDGGSVLEHRRLIDQHYVFVKE